MSVCRIFPNETEEFPLVIRKVNQYVCPRWNKYCSKSDLVLVLHKTFPLFIVLSKSSHTYPNPCPHHVPQLQKVRAKYQAYIFCDTKLAHCPRTRSLHFLSDVQDQASDSENSPLYCYAYAIRKNSPYPKNQYISHLKNHTSSENVTAMWGEKQAFSLVFRNITLYGSALSKTKSGAAPTFVSKLCLEFSYFISSGILERQVLADTSEPVLQGNGRCRREAAESWLLTSSVSKALLCHAFKYLPFTTRFWFFFPLRNS